MADLANAVQDKLDGVRNALVRTGTVTATSPLTVTIAGGTVPANRLTSYTPTIGDVVLVLCPPDRRIILGKVSAS